ncbi:UvrD-helicase domain-containing protein [Sphingobacterium pedocola]|uniref:UvrD-like helicase ATP-binding domain-containing protein n=1 Tax=Sphingobacterium pedocola TaxID=2082722 RepID=A0ABR9TBH6_9SPHI|nr:UvrD-helicase domain-containing protein [Sphingobacterium pedocola]MBE8722708.1 hypothetical protein [Sphingobacterium pedocola]
MKINPDHLIKAEELLIDGEEFDEERKKFIFCKDTRDLLAVPGSGKTTALLAKLYCIAQQMPLKDNAGILVLSHTNHAVEEIEKVLRPVCPQLFSYPNFVGTIQSFANKFIANQACFELYGSYIRKNDDEISENELIQRFRGITFGSKLGSFIFHNIYSQFAKITVKDIVSATNGSAIDSKRLFEELKEQEKIDRKGGFNYRLVKNIDKKSLDPIDLLLSNIHKTAMNAVTEQKTTFCFRYKLNISKRKFTSSSGDLSFDSESGRELLSYFESAFKKGVLRYSDSISLATYYVAKYPELMDVLRIRFKQIFIDEMQDLDQEQIDLIEAIFFTADAGTIIQRIGDKNQSIYSSSSLISDTVWKTRYESDPDRFPKNLSLNKSHRLTETIGKLVDGFVLSRDIGYEVVGSSKNENIAPYLLVYKDETDADLLKKKFVELIKQHQLEKNEKNVKKGFHIIAWTTDKDEASDKWHLRKLFPDYTRESKQKKEDFDCLRKHLFLFDRDKKTFESIRKSLLNGIIRILRIEQIYHDTEKRKYFRKSSFVQLVKSKGEDFYQSFKEQLFDWCYSIVVCRDYDRVYVEYYTYIKDNLIALFPEFKIDKSHDFITKQFLFIESEGLSKDKKEDSALTLKLGSIHSVKGQTHCATMYVETDYHSCETHKLNVELKKGSKTKHPILADNPIYFRRQSISKKGSVRSNEALKMMYVGFSRPTHLLCFAVRKENVKNDLDKYRESGWNVIEI